MIDRGELVTLAMIEEMLRKNHGVGSAESLDQRTDKE